MSKENTVLIVDDQKENVDALRGMLENDYKIYVSLNGKGALSIIEKVSPDIVLLDVNMNDMDGFEVHRRMKEMGKIHIPVIYITGENDALMEARGLKHGAVDYILKPYNPDIVTIKVKNQMENKMYRDELERLVDIRTQEVSKSREAIIYGMSILAEGRDNTTGEHIMRMQKYTEIIAKRFSADYPELLSESDVKEIVLYAPLHDIGKVCIPDSVLKKTTVFTPEDFVIMEHHTTYGADILRKTRDIVEEEESFFSKAVEISECHHEKFDGSGYPNKLKGEEIPLSARIVSLADIYDALTSPRRYKLAFPHEEVMDIILKGDGRIMPEHFDPKVLQTFVDVSEEIRELKEDFWRENE